jgi:hypothetical protein
MQIKNREKQELKDKFEKCFFAGTREGVHKMFNNR